NVDSRLSKVASGEVDAAVLAQAGLDRLGKSDLISQHLDLDQMVPAPGQGALAVETRASGEFAELARCIDDGSLRTLVSTERLLLAETGAGCRSALGAYATWQGDRIRLECFVADERGRRRTVVIGDTSKAVVAEARKELKL
ncbi:MAG TPA: hydroxymethylbilane synthase, partial [Acidimicrobiia bacterium]|nr:hydroxymethylbilane synthase [Acidimicrobiia bacterium]